MTNVSCTSHVSRFCLVLLDLLGSLGFLFADQPNNVELDLPKNLMLLDFKILIKTLLCLILWFPLSFFHCEFAGPRETAKNLGLGEWGKVHSMCISENSLFLSNRRGISRIDLTTRQHSLILDAPNDPCKLTKSGPDLLFTHYQKSATFCAREVFGTRFQIIKMVA